MNYVWYSINLQEIGFLAPLRGLLDDEVKLFLDAGEDSLTRRRCDGIWLLIGRLKGRAVCVAWSDFRVQGGSFGREMSRRFVAFLESPETSELPLVLSVSSLGLRFFEGRTIFADAFGLVPCLLRFAASNLVISVCRDRCLGLGALLFGVGHYRLAATPDSILGLAGPEVFALFFGKTEPFENHARAAAQQQTTEMIHEVVRPGTLLTERVRAIFLALDPQWSLPLLSTSVSEGEQASLSANREYWREETIRFLRLLGDRGCELFADFDDQLKVFLIEVENQRIGVLVNPVGQADNLQTYRSLLLYYEALFLFKAIGVPLLVLQDTPGVDPRFQPNNVKVMEQFLRVTKAIIDFPLPKMGIVVGRAFGGATTLSVPIIYGAPAQFALKGRARLGVMHDAIAKKLLANTRNLLGEYEDMIERQPADCSDMVAAGVLDSMIEESQIREVVVRYLINQRE